MSAVIPSGKSSKDLQSQRTFVEQLRRELKVQRVKLSQCANELIQYCEQQGNVDPLVSPKAGHDNPFRNSGSKCVLFWEQAIADFVVFHTEYSFWHWTMVNYLQKARDGFWGRSYMLSCSFLRRLSWIRKQTSKRVQATERRRKASIQTNSQKKLFYQMQRRDDFVTNARHFETFFNLRFWTAANCWDRGKNVLLALQEIRFVFINKPHENCEPLIQFKSLVNANFFLHYSWLSFKTMQIMLKCLQVILVNIHKKKISFPL